MTYLQLMYEFFKTGLFAIGGGLATIPFLKEIAEKYPWFSVKELTDMIAISESTPGPIGVNMATYGGYQAAGLLGGIVATLSLVLPSVIIICIISKFMEKFKNSKVVGNVFYAVRPVSSALIVGSMLSVIGSSLYNFECLTTNFFSGFRIIPILIMGVFIVICFLLPKVHPIFIIALSAVVGILFGEYLV